MGGPTFLTHRKEGGTIIFHTQEADNIFESRGGQTFHVVGGGGHDDADVDEEMYVSEANSLASKVNILVSEASKLSAGARIFRGP